MSTKKKYTLYLISPRQRYINYPAHSELARMFGKRRFMIPLALPTVAALTPDHYHISIFDEDIQRLPLHETPDIVGITTLAATSTRAFELGDHYRKKGVKVVFGGPYASFMREDVQKHSDSIVVGEAEGKWEQCLADFEAGNLQPVYQSDQCCDYKSQKPPRWDLVKTDRIFQVGIQISRGCPFNCEFCLVTKIFGKKMRYRDIDNVIEEIRQSPTRYFFFVDDNLTMNKRFAKELMRRIIPLKISWGCMASIDVATDEELLDLMAEAGCFNILIGFESLNPESLEESHKKHNKAATIYEPAIQKIHARGIHINASFVVGFDHDKLSEFDNIYDFTLRNALPNVNLHLLAAPPGSALYERLKTEGRLLNCDPELGVGHFPTLHYKNMSQIDLFEGYMDTIEKLYSFDTVYQKAVKLFDSGHFHRKGSDISFFLKMRLSSIILKEFILTSNPEKRKLFKYILSLIRSGRISIDKGLGFLLTMLGYRRHIESHRKRMAEYRRIVGGPYPPAPSPGRRGGEGGEVIGKNT
ncbi:MAG: radical SAM protein [Bacteroidetes bacterium]|nr:radical SAM protein [Bacteroidota bacterium]